MPLPAQFSLLHSKFNGFLFAPIGDERDEMLSVFSALTRLGLDPWREAARLAMLPKPLASNSLAATITRLPSGYRDASHAETIAAGLVELLPGMQASNAQRGGAAQSGARTPMRQILTSVTALPLVLARIAMRIWPR